MRIRTVKPEWLFDEKLGALSSDARVLSIAAILLADDHGNGRANPTWLAGQVFGYLDDGYERVRPSLAELSEAGYLRLYRVRGQDYFHVVNWSKHQRVDNAGKPRVPGPEEADSEELAATRGNSRRYSANRGDSRKSAEDAARQMADSLERNVAECLAELDSRGDSRNFAATRGDLPLDHDHDQDRDQDHDRRADLRAEEARGGSEVDSDPPIEPSQLAPSSTEETRRSAAFAMLKLAWARNYEQRTGQLYNAAWFFKDRELIMEFATWIDSNAGSVDGARRMAEDLVNGFFDSRKKNHFRWDYLRGSEAEYLQRGYELRKEAG